VSTAMPLVAADLHAIRDYGQAFSIFLTTSLLGVVVSGSWSDARGPLWPVRFGLLLFGLGLVGSGLAPSFAVLLVGRAVAGFGGGLLIVAIYVVIAEVYPSQLQPRIFSLLSAGWVLPGLIGPVVAGWLAENVSWRAVFLLVPPLAVPPTLALLPRLRPDGRRAAGPPVRSGPRVLAGVGLAAGVLALQWGLGALARSTGPRFWSAVIAVVVGLLLAGSGFHQLAPPGTLTLRRGLPTVITLRGLYSGAFLGVEAFIPLMLVTERGMSAVEAGLVLTGGALGWTVGSFVQARPGLRLPRHLLLVSGAVILGLSEGLLVLAVRPPVPGWAALGFWALAAVGMGLGMSSTSVLILRYSETGAEGRNSSALQVSDALGGALGIGLSGAAFATWHRPDGSDAVLFTVMWLSFGAVALAASLIAFRARPPAVPPAVSPGVPA
jgi:MFS family permease